MSTYQISGLSTIPPQYTSPVPPTPRYRDQTIRTAAERVFKAPLATAASQYSRHQPGQIIDGKWLWGDKEYSVERLDASRPGSLHALYGFTEEGTLECKGQDLDLPLIAIRKAKPDIRPADRAKAMTEDEKGLVHLTSKKVAIAAVHMKEKDLWIVERIPHKVDTSGWTKASSNKDFTDLSENDQNLLKFVKGWLDKTASEEELQIPDFKPSNIMRRANGTFCVVDYANPAREKNWQKSLRNSLKVWSDRNEKIYNYLSENIKAALQPDVSANNAT